MKNRHILLGCGLLIMTALLASCYDDKGNYDYDWIPRTDFTFEESRLSIERGEVLRVTPQIFETSLNQYGNPDGEEPRQVENYDDYDYVWYGITNGKGGRELLSTKWNLDEPIYMKISVPDTHRIEVHATNRNTGVTSSAYFDLEVVGTYRKGFLFLTDDIDGNVDLEIFAQKASNDWVLEKGTLERADFPYRTGFANAVMYQKYCFGSGGENLPRRIWIATGDGVSWIDPIDFSYDPVLNDLEMLMVPHTARTFKKMFRVGPIGTKLFSSSYMMFADDGEVHILNRAGKVRPGIANTNFQPISVAPMFGGNNNLGVMWDLTHKRFVHAFIDAQETGASNSCIPMNDVTDVSIGGECLHLGTSNAHTCIGITRNPDGKYVKYEWDFMSEFMIPGFYVKEWIEYKTQTELVGTDQLGTIDHWVLSTARGDVYVIAGGKMYCYRTYPQNASLNSWQQVVFKDENDVTVTPKFDPVSFLFVENFGAPFSNCFYMATHSDANGGTVYALEPSNTEPKEIKIISTMSGLGNVKSMSFWGY
ncbi:hypothetical protein LJC45_02535 [Alistipes sp. OttesenSCG-928-B03]|nr:hypothetical protein [Alistipes sp. OttesenSCG-928-B03]